MRMGLVSLLKKALTMFCLFGGVLARTAGRNQIHDDESLVGELSRASRLDSGHRVIAFLLSLSPLGKLYSFNFGLLLQ